MARSQLQALGLTPRAIKHAMRKGLLHPIRPGVYAVGRPHITRHGRWMAAILSCGSEAVLSHESAAALWRIRARESDTIEISVPPHVFRRGSGLVVHRRTLSDRDLTRLHGIPVTSAARTLVDVAVRLPHAEVETAVNQADRLDLVDPEELRSEIDSMKGTRGAPVLRAILDRRTFTLTDSELERRFLPIALRAGLPAPRTQDHVNGFRVDFFWPELNLVVETDGLRYHRTPAQQARDRLRDQAHTAAGLTQLRFTRAQVAFEPGYVQRTLNAVAKRLAAA